ncbi:formate/nitrite transporter family protein [Clostridium sp. MB40-C1]|uniref:formate/nitrite transporter family protein n=1 Tax=Clostridium sp. MB40-C1 TaxID=3070996 RepID=UPI0027E1799D|nr:formate/nitrite transporter family protein [Clostridium sp. MB40-C1]WMJ80008.1 formate/nitrite transporter family protein [Clostridium sp. MB40-C1]
MFQIKTPEQITQVIYDKAIKFFCKSFKEIVIGGILAGCFVSLAVLTSVTVCSDMKVYFGEGFTKLIFGIVFTLGLIMIVLSGSELFTGSNLYIVAILREKKYIRKLIKNWTLIYAANFIGSLIMVVMVYFSGVFENKLISDYLINLVQAKVGLSFGQAFIRGVLCNFLVCLAVRVGEASEEISGKIMGFIYVIGAFVINSFEHSVANMFFIPMGMLVAGKVGIHISTYDFIFKNLIPVTLGNIVGGAVFVGVMYYVLHYSQLDFHK